MSKGIEVEGVEVVYNDRGKPYRALGGVSFSVKPGEFVSVIGSSGCGKSTLLSVLEGLRRPTSGRVTVGGKPVEGPGPERGVVFQQYSLFPWMSARDNVAFAIEQSHKGTPKKERLAQADEFLEKVALAGLGHRFPKELSGGQQQRVAIARALAQDSEVLLMDEPFGAIDARNRSVLQDLLLDLWEKGDGQERKTVVFVTHDLEEAILLSDRIIMMQANPGRIQAEFRVPLPRPRRRLELLNNPAYVDFRTRLSKVFFADEAQEVTRA